MRLLAGLGIAILFSGCLAAQRQVVAPSSHSGGASNGARPSGVRSSTRFSSGASAAMHLHAYPAAYGDSAPPGDQTDTEGYQPPSVAYGPPTAPHATPEPIPQSVILDFAAADAGAAPGPPHYYVALKDRHLYLAVAYWVEGSTLHYFLPGNIHNRVALSLVDYGLTERLNRESGTEVRLPAVK